MPPQINLTGEERRVLACLVEKSFTTPDHYPLTTSSLVAACNQKTSRDPVVSYSAALVDATLQLLRDAGWARSGRRAGERTAKHRHVMAEQIGLTDRQLAVWAVLALRGPQSASELSNRTERYGTHPDLDSIEATLGELAAQDPPLAKNIGRRSGQSQDRWIELLGPELAENANPDPDERPGPGSPTMLATPTPSPPETGSAVLADSTARMDGQQELRALEQRVARLEATVAELEQRLCQQ